VTSSIETVPIRDLLARLPARFDPLKQIGFEATNNTKLSAPFLSGVALRQEGSEVIVDRIIIHSPADLIGLRPGDRIQSDFPLESLEYSDYRKSFALNLLRAGQKKTVTLKFVSLSELLDSVSVH
jgi:hypothetical protein